MLCCARSAAKKVLSAVSFSRSSKKFRHGAVAPELYETMSGRGIHEGNASVHATAKFASQPAADNYNKGLLNAVQAGDRAAIGDRVRDLTNGKVVVQVEHISFLPRTLKESANVSTSLRVHSLRVHSLSSRWF